MVKVNSKTELHSFVSDASLDYDGMIDTETLHWDNYRNLINKKAYDSAINFDLLWDVMFMSLLRLSDYKRPKRALTSAEKAKFVDEVDGFIKAVPYSYTFYYELPEGYPLTNPKLFKNVDIVNIDQAFVDDQERLNPPSQFDSLLRRDKQSQNHQLLSVGKKYMRILDKGLVLSGEKAFLESKYSPDRITGIFYALHLVCGTLLTDKLARFSPMPKVYDSEGKYRANFPSPIKSYKAEHLRFDGKKDKNENIKRVNNILTKLLTEQADEIEKARKQICNAFYWYIEFLNTKDSGLGIVFIVSSLDSLFPPRNHTVQRNKQITPTALEKAPLIAEVVSETETDKYKNLGTLELLFEERNNVIHGKTEIHGYSKQLASKKAKYQDLVNNAHELLDAYLFDRVAKYSKSC